MIEILDRLLVGAMILGVLLLWVSAILGAVSIIFLRTPQRVAVLVAIAVGVLIACYFLGGYTLENSLPVVDKYLAGP